MSVDTRPRNHGSTGLHSTTAVPAQIPAPPVQPVPLATAPALGQPAPRAATSAPSAVPAPTRTSPDLARILLVDDHPMYLEGLRGAIETAPWRVVVGSAYSGREAVAAARTLRPDLVILDVHLPDTTGYDVARRIARDLPGAKVLMLTMEADFDTAVECIRAGARGYLLKGSRIESVVKTIDVVCNGHAVLAPEISTQLLQHMTSPAVRELPFPDLTARERAVLELIADGRKNAAIALDLGLSLKTVRNYVSRIFVKIEVADRAAAVVAARRAGLGR